MVHQGPVLVPPNHQEARANVRFAWAFLAWVSSSAARPTRFSGTWTMKWWTTFIMENVHTYAIVVTRLAGRPSVGRFALVCADGGPPLVTNSVSQPGTADRQR